MEQEVRVDPFGARHHAVGQTGGDLDPAEAVVHHLVVDHGTQTFGDVGGGVSVAGREHHQEGVTAESAQGVIGADH